MTRLKRLVIGGAAAALLATGAVSQAFAEEPGSFQNRLQGATIGLPLGAAPPPGLYTGLETAYLGQASGAGQGKDVGNWAALTGGRVGLPAIAQAVPLLYVPGWTFLGANYSMAAVVAFYNYETCNSSDSSCNTVVGGGFVFANPTFTPIALSWNLGNGWFTSLGFNFMAPIGSNYTNTPNPDYWTLEPTFAVSYLANNWVLSANFFYDFNTSSKGPCCLIGGSLASAGNTYNNGDTLYGDLTALYKFGKWEIGPVAFFEVQTSSDSIGGPGAAALCATFCGNYSNVGVGGLIGYDFGPVDIQVWITDIVEAANTPAGTGSLWVWSRLGFKLWSPEAPRPLVAKN
jgi:hypothetical protein